MLTVQDDHSELYGYLELIRLENQMNDLFSMLEVLVIGMTILMAGILINREPGQSFQSALNDSMAWGMGFFVCFGAEFLVLMNV